MTAKKWTPEQEAEIERRYREGEPVAAILRDYGGWPSTLVRALHRRGIPVREQRRPWVEWDPERKAGMVKRWHEGASQTAIAKEFETSQSVVSRLLRDEGIEPEARIRPPLREQHGMWKGGRIIDPHGYVRILVSRDDPMASMRGSTGYVLEHRLVMARALGRPLVPGETVHHKDLNRQHNDLSNLQLRNGNHGKGAVLRCADCGSHNLEGVEI